MKIKKNIILISVVLVMFLILSISTFAWSTTRWQFETFNNPYARNVALSIAQAQKALDEEDEYLYEEESTLEMFQDMLVRQMLSRLTRNVIDNAFGDDNTLEFGDYIIGDFEINIANNGDGVTITINDVVNGGTTVIEVPYYDFSGVTT